MIRGNFDFAIDALVRDEKMSIEEANAIKEVFRTTDDMESYILARDRVLSLYYDEETYQSLS